jgi:hypothetical protein
MINRIRGERSVCASWFTGLIVHAHNGARVIVIARLGVER